MMKNRSEVVLRQKPINYHNFNTVLDHIKENCSKNILKKQQKVCTFKQTEKKYQEKKQDQTYSNWLQNQIQRNIDVSYRRLEEFYKSIHSDFHSVLKISSNPLVLQQQRKEKQIMLLQRKESLRKFLFLNLTDTIIEHRKSSKDFFSTNPFNVNFRPFLFDFLDELKEYYEIYIFTQLEEKQAQAIVNLINRKTPYIRGIVSKKNCIRISDQIIIKDLKVIKNRSLRDIVMVDTSLKCYGSQKYNIIPILKYNSFHEDRELIKIIELLKQISIEYDIRYSLKEKIAINNLLEMPEKKLNTFFSQMTA